jgi:hypothetical protein
VLFFSEAEGPASRAILQGDGHLLTGQITGAALHGLRFEELVAGSRDKLLLLLSSKAFGGVVRSDVLGQAIEQHVT